MAFLLLHTVRCDAPGCEAEAIVKARGEEEANRVLVAVLGWQARTEETTHATHSFSEGSERETFHVIRYTHRCPRHPLEQKENRR